MLLVMQGHNGESREERLAEFLVVNPTVKVVGIREGTALRIHGDSVELVGGDGLDALLFSHGRDPQLIKVGSVLQVADLI
jgi:dipeptidase E